jgi:Recombination endonuclease VII
MSKYNKEYNQAYYAAHIDKIKAQRAIYRAAHREEQNTKNRAYKAAHSERFKEQYNLHKEEISARRKIQYNPSKNAVRKSIAWDKKFGWTIGTHAWLLDLSIAYGCSLCKKPFGVGKLRPATDHNHITGEFRGIIHKSCNIAIGLLEDNPGICLRAAAYLN